MKTLTFCLLVVRFTPGVFADEGSHLPGGPPKGGLGEACDGTEEMIRMVRCEWGVSLRSKMDAVLVINVAGGLQRTFGGARTSPRNKVQRRVFGCVMN